MRISQQKFYNLTLVVHLIVPGLVPLPFQGWYMEAHETVVVCASISAGYAVCFLSFLLETFESLYLQLEIRNSGLVQLHIQSVVLED